MTTRAIRFSEKENEAIKDFLEKNPYLDFSTIGRLAIKQFIENPQLTLRPTNIKDLESQETSNDQLR